MEKFLASIGFTKSALIVLGVILTPIGAWFINLLKKNYKEISEARKEINEQKKIVLATLEEIKNRQRDISLEFSKQRGSCAVNQRKELDSLKKRLIAKFDTFKKNQEETTRRLFSRVDENKTSLTSVLDRMMRGMTIYDDKLFELEKRVQDGTISRPEYYKELSKIKDEFYSELRECQKSMIGLHTVAEGIPELASATRRLIVLNKKLLEYESKFSTHEEKLEYYERILKNNCHSINDNEKRNLERHKATKQIVNKSIVEVKKETEKVISEVNKIIHGHKISTQKQINEINERQQETERMLKLSDIDDRRPKGKDINLDEQDSFGRVIRRVDPKDPNDRR